MKFVLATGLLKGPQLLSLAEPNTNRQMCAAASKQEAMPLQLQSCDRASNYRCGEAVCP